MLSFSVSLSLFSVIIVISELVLHISSLIRFSLCFSDLALLLILYSSGSFVVFISTVGTCLRLQMSAFLFGLVW